MIFCWSNNITEQTNHVYYNSLVTKYDLQLFCYVIFFKQRNLITRFDLHDIILLLSEVFYTPQNGIMFV